MFHLYGFSGGIWSGAKGRVAKTDRRETQRFQTKTGRIEGQSRRVGRGCQGRVHSEYEGITENGGSSQYEVERIEIVKHQGL